MPAPDLFANRLQCHATHGRQKIDVCSPIFTERPPRLKGVTQEIERYDGMFTCTVHILAVDDLGLRIVQFKTTITESLSHLREHVLRLRLRPTMKKTVVSIATEQHTRHCSFNPRIERIVEKQIREQRTYDASLRCAFCAFLDVSQACHDWRCQPAPHVMCFEIFNDLLTVASSSRLPGYPVDLKLWLDDPTPSLLRHYSGLIATTGLYEPRQRVGTIGLTSLLVPLPLRRFPRFPQFNVRATIQGHAASMPGATWPVARLPPS